MGTFLEFKFEMGAVVKARLAVVGESKSKSKKDNREDIRLVVRHIYWSLLLRRRWWLWGSHQQPCRWLTDPASEEVKERKPKRQKTANERTNEKNGGTSDQINWKKEKKKFQNSVPSGACIPSVNHTFRQMWKKCSWGFTSSSTSNKFQSKFLADIYI